MKKVALFVAISSLLFSISYAQGDNTAKNRKNYKTYQKYLSEPLKKSSGDIYSGEVCFKMSIWQIAKEEPTIYDCKMNFSRWPLNNYFLPNLNLTIGDSIRYVIDKDSLYTFDIKNQICKVDFFKEGLTLLLENPFLSFYAQWFDWLGNVENINVSKQTNLCSVDFVFAEKEFSKQKKSNAGLYNLSYSTDKHIIKSYSYAPILNLQKVYGFEKIQYDLVSFQKGESCVAWDNLKPKSKNEIVSSFIREQRMSSIREQNYEDIIKRCNVGINIGTKGKDVTEIKLSSVE